MNLTAGLSKEVQLLENFCNDRCASIRCCCVPSRCRCFYSRLEFDGTFLKKDTGFCVCERGHRPGTTGALHNPLIWEIAAAADVLLVFAPSPQPSSRWHPNGDEPQSLCAVNWFIDNYTQFRRYFSESPSHIRPYHPLFCDTAVRIQVFPQFGEFRSDIKDCWGVIGIVTAKEADCRVERSSGAGLHAQTHNPVRVFSKTSHRISSGCGSALAEITRGLSGLLAPA